MIGDKISIFIDTNVFEKMGYNFDKRNDILKKYTEIVNTKRYENVIVTVIDNEIKEHINKKIEENLSKIKKHCKWIYNVLDKETIEKNIKKELLDYDEFKKNTNSKLITTEKVNPEKVLDEYFNIIPPFKQSKRNEFKDAFFIESVFQYAIDNPRNISYIVITKDNDIKEAIKNKQNKKILCYDGIEEFIESTIRNITFSKEKLEDYLNQFNFLPQIEKLATISTSFIEEEEIDIDNYEYNGIYFPRIINVDNKKITIACDMSITLNGYFKCLDYDKSIYSKEEEEYIYVEYIERPFLMFICQTVIEVEVDNDKFSNAQIVDFPEIEIDFETFTGEPEFKKN